MTGLMQAWRTINVSQILTLLLAASAADARPQVINPYEMMPPTAKFLRVNTSV